jgi:MFS family permease
MRYIEFLKNNPIVRRLSLIQFIVYFGTWFTNVAIYTLLAQLGASATLISIVAAMHFIPAILLAPISGPIIDKSSYKKLMFTLLVVEMIFSFMLLNINNLDDIALLLFFIFMRMCGGSFYFTAEMSLLPHLLKKHKELQMANEIHSMIWSFTFTAGMALGGIIVDSYGVKSAIIIDGMMFVLAIFMFSSIKIEIDREKHSDSVMTLIKSGIAYLKNNPLIVHLLILHASVGLTTYDTLVTVLANVEYKEIISVPLAIGFIHAIRALSLTIGPIFLGKIINKDNLGIIFILQAIGIFAWAMMQFDFYISFIGIFMTGFFASTLWSYTYALIQENCEKEYLGRVIAYNDMLFTGMIVITTIITGFLIDYGLELNIITMLLGVGFIFYAIYYRWLRNKYSF